MRIQLRLSHEARIVLEELKLDYLRKDVVRTSGDIIDELFEHFKNCFDKIDWLSVQVAPEFDGILADYTAVNPTTLNLNEQTINSMSNLREILNTRLGMKRTVYRSFIIRIILKAFRLEKEGINIYLR